MGGSGWEARGKVGGKQEERRDGIQTSLPLVEPRDEDDGALLTQCRRKDALDFNFGTLQVRSTAQRDDDGKEKASITIANSKTERHEK